MDGKFFYELSTIYFAELKLRIPCHGTENLRTPDPGQTSKILKEVIESPVKDVIK